METASFKYSNFLYPPHWLTRNLDPHHCRSQVAVIPAAMSMSPSMPIVSRHARMEEAWLALITLMSHQKEFNVDHGKWKVAWCASEQELKQLECVLLTS